ncbi:nucleolar protein 12 [Condylostylus longicornis]|uniref:nucleolar protein 12 n=1 Tax=Condylostylus longicornis TaxID=2530218 RepID=UPI00244DAB6E|nr:nucleolar protein 12 [Condylostylus longicornis]
MGRKKKLPKKPKLEIIYDEKSRKDFLTGFRKRKNERRKRAKLELEEMVKNERKRIREEAKNDVNKLKKSYAPLPFEDDIIEQEKYAEENDDVTVKVIELTTKEIAEKRNFLGQNEFSESEEEVNTNEEVESEPEEIPGMSLTRPKKTTLKFPTKEKENTGKQKNGALNTKRDVNKMMQKVTLKSIKKSKVFKMKERFNRLENKKLAKRQKNRDIRQLKSQGRRIEKKPNFRLLNKIRGKNPHKRRK